uniref:Reverse transcriptase domain-containing protein n=1 Tax=Trichobilharzia regenti TaxID=157069 RepID=A0AA85J2L2_TRIRE|nr:unnamed protein product [Trichobilharzia regenti]
MKDKSGVKRTNFLIKSEMQRLNVIYNQKFISCKNPSNMWKLFKEITGGKQINNIPYSFDVCTLNKSFIYSPSNAMLPSITCVNNSPFPGFNTNDVQKCLKSLNPSQSLGPDYVPSIIFKKCSDILCHPLTDLFNKSFSDNIVPAVWKDIKVVPIPKSSTGACVKFRPIAITSPFLKTMEKLLLLSLVPSLKSFNDPKQFAYKHSRSTLDAAAVLYHNIASSLDKGAKFVRCAFLDYTSAFDSVPRDILLNKLAASQTECWAVNWLHSYFSDRKQYTVYKGKSSTSLPTEAGVPQGAVLSPFLFSFFLHDLPHSDEINFVKYADDLTVSMAVNSQLDCTKINSFLSEVSKWSESNGLKLNPSKCQTVDFSLRCKRQLKEVIDSHDSCKIDDNDIGIKSEIKYLGLILSSDLSWSSHVLAISSKIFRLTFYIKKLRHSGITQPLLLQFINSCILPILLYCSPLFFPGLLKKDYVTIRRILKTVSRVSGVPVDHIVNVVVDRHLTSCNKFAKGILSDLEHPLYPQLSPCISSGRTRSNFRKLYARTSKYKNSMIPYLARILCDENSVRQELTNLFSSSK